VLQEVDLPLRLHLRPGFSVDDDAEKQLLESLEALAAILNQQRRLALLGEVGAGKTMTLMRLADYLREASETMLPLVIPLSEFNGKQPLDDYLTSVLPADLPRDQIIYLFDAARPDAAVMRSINTWLRDHREAMVVLATDRDTYLRNSINLQRIDVLATDAIRIWQALGAATDSSRADLFWALAGTSVVALWERWLAAGGDFATFWALNPAAEEMVRLDAPAQAAYRAMCWQWNELGLLPNMLAEAQNMLTLALLAEFYDEQKRLPTNRGELFAAGGDLGRIYLRRAEQIREIARSGRVPENPAWWQPHPDDLPKRILLGLEAQRGPKAVDQTLAWIAGGNPALACRTAADFGIAPSSEAMHALRTRCAALLVDPTLPPEARAVLGRAINAIGDPRPGVLNFDLQWCFVPAGSFIYGAEGEIDVQQLSLPDFWMARTHITYAQFQRFLDAEDGFAHDHWWEGLYACQRPSGNQGFKIANHPRERVSWYDVTAFARWLDAQARQGKIGLPEGLTALPEGYEIRLPTDFEWEKAARGVDGQLYPYGPECDPQKSNLAETGIIQTTAVGLFPEGASPYGVLDMSGNAWEWTRSGVDDPTYTASEGGGARVLRGGSWRNGCGSARATRRLRGWPAFRSDDVGIRLVIAPRIG